MIQQQLHNLNYSIGTTILIRLHYSYAIELSHNAFLILLI